MELQLRLCSAGSLELLGHHHGAAASQELFHPGLGWDLHAWPGCSVLLTAASPSPSSLLLVLFQCFLLELFEVFWDVCSCKLIDRLG